MSTILLALALVGGVDECLHPRQFRIDVLVCKGDPLGSKADGTVKHLAEPSLVAFNGRSVSFHTGAQLAVTGVDGKQRFEAIGTGIEVLPLRYANGKVWVEVNATDRQAQGVGLPGQPVFTEQVWRHARFVTPGEKFRFRIAAESPEMQIWAEVTVSDEPRGK